MDIIITREVGEVSESLEIIDVKKDSPLEIIKAILILLNYIKSK